MRHSRPQLIRKLLSSFRRELKHEFSTVIILAMTFIGATLVGRTVWEWVGSYYNGWLAFGLGIVVLFFVAYGQHHHYNK